MERMKAAAKPDPLIAEPTVLELKADTQQDAGEPSGALAEAHYIVTHGVGLDAAELGRAARCLAVIIAGPGVGAGSPQIDFEAARRLGIYLTSIPDHATEPWAAEAFGRLRTLLGEAGRPLRGARLGIVGLGQVGRRLAEIALAEKLRVAAFDPFVDQHVFEKLGVRRLDLKNLIGSVHGLVLAVPPSRATRGLISEEALAMAQAGLVIVNAGADDVLERAALLRAIQHGQIARAWLGEGEGEDQNKSQTEGCRALREAGRLRCERMQAGVQPEAQEALRVRIAGIIAELQAGQRPSHLLIDPPCPRHILQLAGEFPEPNEPA